MNQCPQCGRSGDGKFCSECGVEMVTACWSCGQARAAKSKFCSHCNAPSEPPAAAGSGVTGSNVRIGDIGVLRGTIDASTYVSTSVGSQTNISGDVHVLVVSEKLALHQADAIKRIRDALAIKDYRTAFQLSNHLIVEHPENPEGRYLYALSIVKGRRPKSLALDEVRRIESSLLAAIQLDEQPHYLHCLALIRNDYYVSNRMLMPTPNVSEIMRQSRLRNFNISETRFVLDHVPVPNSPLLQEILSRCER